MSTGPWDFRKMGQRDRGTTELQDNKIKGQQYNGTTTHHDNGTTRQQDARTKRQQDNETIMAHGYVDRSCWS